jgi:dephospho-CoA kinase
MLKIGLTGGIGSGKSTVAKIFELFGIPIYYADDAAKQLMNTDPHLKEQIIKRFGVESYTENGLNRNYIAKKVFDNKESLEFLNALVHPATLRDAEIWMQNQTTPYAIKEAALIFESGAERFLDYVIGISAPEALRISRVQIRDEITPGEITTRIENQLNEDKKMSMCDFIIFNDGLQPLLPQVIVLNQKLLYLAQKRS